MENIIKTLRGELSQAAFAKKVGIAQATIATYETGRSVTLEKLERIARAAGKKITLIIEDLEEKP